MPSVDDGAQPDSSSLDGKGENVGHVGEVSPSNKGKGNLELNASADRNAGSTSDELQEDCDDTPPLPNGDQRLHPLFDEAQIANEAATRMNLDKKQDEDTSSEKDSKSRPNTLRLMDSMANEPGYPSPSGGFVPPVTDENWTLSDPPAPRSAKDAVKTDSSKHFSSSITPSTGAEGQTQIPDQGNQLSPSSSSDAARRHSADIVNTTPSSSRLTQSTEIYAPQAGRRAAFNPLEDGEGDRKRKTSSNSSSHFYASQDNAEHSQAISARSSPSTVAPTRQRSSTSADLSIASKSEYEHQDSLSLPPLRIRDFAFPELDPRHLGARDVGLPSPESERRHGGYTGMGLGLGGGGSGSDWNTGADEYDDDDDDDDVDDEGDDEEFSDGAGISGSHLSGFSTSSSGQTGLPPGLYHAAYDFAAESEHELDVKVGQRVRLIGHVDGGWAIVVRVAEGREDVAADDEEVEKGLVPEAYLQWLAN